VYELVTLASIIEKEEKTDANKATIASIFYNRWGKGMYF
jgi:cell division protein YceG involved in septum cleavage